MDRVNQETLARASNKSLINQGNFNSIELPLEGLSFLFCLGENKSKIQNETNKTDFMRSIKGFLWVENNGDNTIPFR